MMDDNSTSNSQQALANDDVYDAHCNMLSSSSISSAMSGENNYEDENGEDFNTNTNTVDSNKSILDPAVMDDTARDTLISFPTPIKNSSNLRGRSDGENSDEDANQDDEDDTGEVVSAEASDDGELMSDGESRNKKEDSEGELKSSDDEQNDDADGEDLEEGEVLPDKKKKKKVETNNNISKINNSSKNEEDLEEGEVSDEDNLKPKSICRFFGKGQCTWGSNCRFLHPGVTDKGFYSMFENVRPPLLPNPPPPSLQGPMTPQGGQPPPPAMMYPKPGLLGHAPPNYPPISPMVKPGGPLPQPPSDNMMLPLPPPVVPVMPPGPPIPETAWERGLRHAKEMLKQSAARKETDIDFEDKKMNQSLNEDLDKENENDYYINARKAGDEIDNDRDIMRRREFDPTNLDVTRERMNHRLEKRREAPPRDRDDDMMIRRKRREAPPLAPDEKPPIRFPPGAPQVRGPPPGSADDWHDPWMRSSSYHRRPRRRSRSESYSSGSDHRRRQSSGNESSPSRNRKIRKAPPRNLSPKPMRIAPPKEEPFERPPVGSRLERGAMKRRITRSRSTSRSSSSSASSASTPARKRQDSWSSSSSSASKSSSSSAYKRRAPPAKKRHVVRKPSPPKPVKKSSPPPVIPPGRQQPPPPIRQAPSRQQQQQQAMEKKRTQIKMTLKEQGKVKMNRNVLDKLSDEIMGTNANDDDDDDSLHSNPISPVEPTTKHGKKKNPGRREELLKQLKAVEDAIAKKRSKIL